MQRFGCHAAKHRQQRAAEAGDDTGRNAPDREMETGEVAARHREHAAQHVKDNSDEFVEGHVLAIEYAAERDAKHR